MIPFGKELESFRKEFELFRTCFRVNYKLDFDENAGLFSFFFSIDKYLVNVIFHIFVFYFIKDLNFLSFFIVFHFK